MLKPAALLEEYGISHVGFLPRTQPLQSLGVDFEAWENIAKNLPELIRDDLVRDHVDRLAILSTNSLRKEAQWRRAYVILSFLAHAYIWGSGKPSERLPPQISVPYLTVSARLGVPPVATYASLNLWNFTTTSGGYNIDDLVDPSRLKSLLTFTGTMDEEWFYIISVAIEAKGAPIIQMMIEAMLAAAENNAVKVILCLRAFVELVRSLEKLLARMDDRCKPTTFYHNIRPFLAGSRNMAVAGLPRGVFYDKGNGEGEWRQFRGGSNAQSPLIQLLDVALQVQHNSMVDDGKSQRSFHEEMRSYMSPQHRQFLEYVARIANIQDFVYERNDHDGLRESFNAAVAALASFRDRHVQIVTRYIIIPSRQAMERTPDKLNLATASLGEAAGLKTNAKELHGTGGTMLIPFLRQTRDATTSAAVA